MIAFLVYMLVRIQFGSLWPKREAARVSAWRALDQYAVGEFSLQLFGWDRPRRFVVIREQLPAERPSLGRKLLEVPGYTAQYSLNVQPGIDDQQVL